MSKINPTVSYPVPVARYILLGITKFHQGCSLARARVKLQHHSSSKTNHKAIIQEGLSVLLTLSPELGDIMCQSVKVGVKNA